MSRYGQSGPETRNRHTFLEIKNLIIHKVRAFVEYLIGSNSRASLQPAAFLHSQVLGALDVAVFTVNGRLGLCLLSLNFPAMLREADNDTDPGDINLTVTSR